MHLPVKHLGLGDRPRNAVVYYLVLKQLNPPTVQMKNDAKFF